MAYDYTPYPYVPPPGLHQREARHPVAVVGAGPIGLALAIDLALRGIRAVVLDDNNVVSVGSRAICWAQRTLEIFDRLGVGERMRDKGVTWQVGRNFHGPEEVYAFDLQPEAGHKYPAFVNLQQYYVEEYLIERAQELGVDLRFRNRVVAHRDHGDHVSLSVETPDGAYTLEAAYLCACDGAGSPTRTRMGLCFDGQTFDEHFLIADVEMAESPFETARPERWFWFHPPFHSGQSALLHAQPDNIYRIDLQLGPDADPATEAQEDKVVPRIRAIVGDRPFRLDWMSVYKFRCARLDRFVHGRVIFVGDSAHVVSPFGARGGNGGIQDADNLGWKLAAVLEGAADAALIETYDTERGLAADENIRNSTRATNFMTPKSAIERLFRDEVLRLAHDHPFARRLVNSGRLSRPAALPGAGGDADPVLGRAMMDAPLGDGWLLERVQGRFALVAFGDVPLPEVDGVARLGIGTTAPDYPCVTSPGGVAEARYGKGTAVLFRPDGHAVARFESPTAETVGAAVRKTLGPAGVPA